MVFGQPTPIRVAACGLSRPTNLAERSLAKLTRAVTVTVPSGLAPLQTTSVPSGRTPVPSADGRMCKVEAVVPENVRDHRRRPVGAGWLHLEDAAVGAVLDLDLH